MVPAEYKGCRVLVVEDNSGNAALFQRVLTEQGYSVSVAVDGVEALDHLQRWRPDLILLDLDMPRLNGYEVCRRVKQDPATRLIPIIIVTGEDAADAKLKAWELGADDFLNKPLQNVELVARCRSLLRLKHLIDELDTAEAVVFALARAIEAKSPYTQGHAERVTRYSLALAEQIGMSAQDQELLHKGALLHDIGKISIPDAILDKPGILTPEEFDVVKLHPIQGTRIVEPLRSLRDVVPLIRWHHERMDGQGYPDGLLGKEIPDTVRVLSVADVYDSLASQRPYRAAMPHVVCLKTLRNSADSGGLDKDLVETFCQMTPENWLHLQTTPTNEASDVKVLEFCITPASDLG